MAFAQYRGCSKDDCGVPFAHTEMHHAENDWADGGLTDSTNLAPACGPHNRAVGTEPHQWSTEKITDGPDKGRYGTARANHLHRIDELLRRHLAHGGEESRAESRDPSPPGRTDVVWPPAHSTYAA
ncbi:HNH endonuclease signature motif containing protein [Williamsia sp. M5A3_1d]